MMVLYPARERAYAERAWARLQSEADLANQIQAQHPDVSRGEALRWAMAILNREQA